MNLILTIFVLFSGKPFNNHTIINAAVANIIVSILMDHRFDYDDPTLLKLMKLINENVKIAGSTMIRVSVLISRIFLKGKSIYRWGGCSILRQICQVFYATLSRGRDTDNVGASFLKNLHFATSLLFHLKMYEY